MFGVNSSQFPPQLDTHMVNVEFGNGDSFRSDVDLITGALYSEGGYYWKCGHSYQGRQHRGNLDGHGCMSWTSEETTSESMSAAGCGCRDASGDTLRETLENEGEGGTERRGLIKRCMYKGQWMRNTQAGEGTFSCFKCSSFYSGGWHGGLAEGEGVFYNGLKEQLYIGSWEKGKENGWGKKIYFINFHPSQLAPEPFTMYNIYAGQWKDGERHGQGLFTYFEGTKYEGPWIRNKKHGHGLIYTPGSDRKCAKFHNNQIVNSDGKKEVFPQHLLTCLPWTSRFTHRPEISRFGSIIITPLLSALGASKHEQEENDKTKNTTDLEMDVADAENNAHKTTVRGINKKEFCRRNNNLKDAETLEANVKAIGNLLELYDKKLKFIYWFYSCVRLKWGKQCIGSPLSKGSEDETGWCELAGVAAPLMINLQFQRLMKDCKFHCYKFTIMELLHILKEFQIIHDVYNVEATISYPNFILSLIAVSHALFTASCFPRNNQDPSNTLGAKFQKLVETCVLPGVFNCGGKPWLKSYEAMAKNSEKLSVFYSYLSKYSPGTCRSSSADPFLFQHIISGQTCSSSEEQRTRGVTLKQFLCFLKRQGIVSGTTSLDTVLQVYAGGDTRVVVDAGYYISKEVAYVEFVDILISCCEIEAESANTDVVTYTTNFLDKYVKRFA